MNEGAFRQTVGRGFTLIIASVCFAMVGIVALTVSFLCFQWNHTTRTAGNALLFDATLAAQYLDSELAFAELALQNTKRNFLLPLTADLEQREMTSVAFKINEVQNVYLLDEEGLVLASAFTRVAPSLSITFGVLGQLEAGMDSLCRIVDAPAEGGKALVLLEVLRRDPPLRYAAVVFSPIDSRGRVAALFPQAERTIVLSDDSGGSLLADRAAAQAKESGKYLQEAIALSKWPLTLRISMDRSALTREWFSQGLSLVLIVAALVGITIVLLIFGAVLSRRANRVDELTRLTNRLREEIVEHRKDEQAREASEERYRFALEVTDQIGWSTRPDGIVEDLPLWRQYSGQSVEEVRGWGWLDTLHPDDRESAQRAWSAAVAQKSRYETEYRLRRADGEYRHFLVRGIPLFDADGSCQEWVGTCIDITDRNKAEEVLRESEERFRRLFAGHSAVKMVIDPHSGRIIDANEAAASFYGWSLEELKRMSIQEINLVPSDSLKVALERSRALTQTRFEFRHRLADGSVRDVEVFSNNIEIRGRDHLFSIVHDITERRQAELALLASLDEKTTLLKEVHHRVKNNLQIVASLINLQASRMGAGDAVIALRNIEGRILSMALLHESLYRSGNLAHVDFSFYVEELCAQLLRSLGPSSGRVALERRVERLGLSLDQALPCGLIINELVSNALKHAFPGERQGRIVVELRLAEAGLVALRVDDDGVGLPTGLDADSTPTLGLRLVGNLARQLGGVRGTEKTGPEGTTILVTFPIGKDGRVGSSA
ncbi:MAG: PAS domain S-box protein [Spirochaetota bacterium]